jgi:hypothetical protein
MEWLQAAWDLVKAEPQLSMLVLVVLVCTLFAMAMLGMDPRE